MGLRLHSSCSAVIRPHMEILGFEPIWDGERFKMVR